jgi:hypothetical protein
MSGFSRILNLVLLPMILLWAAESGAGEAYIKKARGNRLIIDQGAEAGLAIGMEVLIVRPPGEAVIHPVSGENLGSPEIRVGVGKVTKTSARAATVVIGRSLLTVQSGDMVRFTTVDEEMIMDQERSMVQEERAQKERQQIKGNLSELTRNIKKTQGTINNLRGAIKRLDRIDETIKVQLRGINDDIHGMKEEISALKESVNLMGVLSVSEEKEGTEVWIEVEENQEVLKDIIRDVIEEERPAPASKKAMAEPKEEEEEEEEVDLSMDALEDLDAEIEDEEESFLDKYGMYLLLGGACSSCSGRSSCT